MTDKSYKSEESQKDARAKLNELILNYPDNPFFKVFRSCKKLLSKEIIESIQKNYTLFTFQKQNLC